MTTADVPTTTAEPAAAGGPALIAAQLRALADARRALGLVRGTLDQRRAALNVELRPMLDERDRLARGVGEQEEAVRAAALAYYAATGAAKPTPGVEVRTFAVLDYDDAAALVWAKEKQMALIPEQLDARAFEKIASVTALDFVERREKSRALIATDLDKALGLGAAQ